MIILSHDHFALLAIEIADGTNNKNLAKSLFIKTKAIMSLEDYVAAFPIAVWCKHLRPNVSENEKLAQITANIKISLHDVS